MSSVKVIFIPLVVCLFAFGCQTQPEPTFVIGFSQCTGGDAWRERMLFQMNRQLTFHPDLRLEYRDALGRNDLQVAHIEELLEMNVDLLIVTPNEAEPLTAVIDKAYAAGVPVILVDRKTSDQNFTCFLGADNVEVGKLAGNRAVALTQPTDQLLEITGLAGSTPAQDRHQGFVEELQAAPDKRSLITLHADWTARGARQVLLARKDSLADVDVVFAHNDVMALAARQYFDSLGQAVKVIGVDGLPQLGMEAVITGEINSTVLYPTGGAEAIKLAADILNGKPTEKLNELVITLIDERNAAILQQQAFKIIEQMELIWSYQEVVDTQRDQAELQTRWNIGMGALVLVLALFIITVIRSNRLLKAQKAIIEEQRAHVEKLNAAKDKFFRILAHDLRNPLASLKLFSNVLLHDYDRLSKTEVMTLAENLESSVDNTLKMTDNITAWAKVQMKEVSHVTEKINVKEHVQACVDVYSRMADTKAVRINATLDSNLAVKADRHHLDFILRNLINNAVKFTRQGGEVTISASELTNGSVCIFVRDTGIGIPKGELAHLFESVHRRSTQGTQGELGTGLGLVLCDEFVRMNGGSIHVESLPDKGSTFRIFLPKA